MKKLIHLSASAAVALIMVASCNSDYTPIESVSSSVAVTSFKFSADDSVLANLDTVFFAIDLNRGRIFNADSMPYGTRIDRLVPVINVLEPVSEALLTVTRKDGTDTIYNYMTNPTDTIDFSNGPVQLLLTSLNGAVSMNYSITVNVHAVKSDSLVWSKTDLRAIPSVFNVPTAQRTVQCGDILYCLTRAADRYSIATAANPDGEWETSEITLPADADMNSFNASDRALYIMAAGELYESIDGAATWTATGQRWDNIYGGYTDHILGNRRNNDGTFALAVYPATEADGMAIPADMPVRGMSQPIAFSFPMSVTPQILMVGGYRADGTLSPDTWAFDGYQLARLSTTPLPSGMAYMTAVPFFAYRVNNAFIATRYSILMAWGGTKGGEINRKVYTSNDCGMTWTEGGSLIQLPEAVPTVYGAQSYVYSQILPQGRATDYITEWECPYIYTFGGTRYDGTLSNTVWKATLNRLTFKPLQ